MSADPALRRAMRGGRIQFTVLGALMGLWGAHVASVKAAHGLSDGALGAVLLLAALGSACLLPFAASLVHRHGPRACAQAAGATGALALMAVLLAPHPALLWALAWALGASATLLDVAVNAEAVTLEERWGRPCMIGLHAMFSVGGMAGAASVALLWRLGVLPVWQLALLPPLLAAWLAGGCRAMLSTAGQGEAAQARWQLPRGRLLALGGLAAAGFLAEGSMYDWSVVYLRDVLQAPPDQAALGYAAFTAAMALTRFGGDALRQRWPAERLLAASGLVAAGAMALALVARTPALAIVALAGVGLGLANVAPLIYRAASQQPGVTPAAGISAAVSVSFIGFVSGPPLIGALAELGGLRLALLVVVAAALALVPGARAARVAPAALVR